MEFNWQEIFELFKKPNVMKEYKLEFREADEEKIKRILCERHDFSKDRVESALEKLKEAKELNKQKALDQWFG